MMDPLTPFDAIVSFKLRIFSSFIFYNYHLCFPTTFQIASINRLSCYSAKPRNLSRQFIGLSFFKRADRHVTIRHDMIIQKR